MMSLLALAVVRMGDNEKNDAAAVTRRTQLGAGEQEREFSSEKAERKFLAKQITTRALKPLARQLPIAKFTVLGDLNQAIFTKDNAANLQEDLASLFDSERVDTVKLTQTYRSTQQITDFTKDILLGGQDIEAFNRNGEKPIVKIADDESELLNKLRQQLLQNAKDQDSTAIITKTLADAKLLAQQLVDKSCDTDSIRKSTFGAGNHYSAVVLG
ncbi:hypothetical protein Pfo_031231 [Paulownia fortunei]|nr:hypothetical protein Pfo_031231 [Paulownia fortunei]